MAAYNPMSYHNGSVWPHDNAIIAAGLMRYGFVEQAQRVAEGHARRRRAFGGRLPELFCGFDRAEFPAPVPYPTSCSPAGLGGRQPAVCCCGPCCASTRASPTVDSGWLRRCPRQLGDLRVDGSRRGSRLR